MGPLIHREVGRMAVVRYDRFCACGGSSRDSFPEHNERMRRFRESHNDELQTKADLPGRVLACNDTSITAETVGSGDLIDVKAWSVIIPLWRISGNRFSKN